MVGAESLDGRARLTDRPIDRLAADLNSYDGDALLARALKRARWSILWERLWPALATLATVIGLFLAISWFGIWLMLPPFARADRFGLFCALAPPALPPYAMLRVRSGMDGLRRLDRNRTLQHRPATTISDELAADKQDSFAVTLWRAHIERALRAAKTLRAGRPVPRLAVRSEEHTSELQSLRHLVCRLLLETE